MKPLNFPMYSWLSLLAWQLGPVRWWLFACVFASIFCIATAVYWNNEAAEFNEESETVFKKIKTIRAASAGPNSVSNSNRPNAELSSEQQAQLEPQLPPLQATKASPLGRFLTEPKLKGVVIKQVDYVWANASSPASKLIRSASNASGLTNPSVGRLDVNLNIEGSYPAVRAWLGELLYEESNVQVNAIQFQRQSRDSQIINGVISLSVYFQEAK
jgi:hypothetical protein